MQCGRDKMSFLQLQLLQDSSLAVYGMCGVCRIFSK